jgi:hypothetical protein
MAVGPHAAEPSRATAAPVVEGARSAAPAPQIEADSRNQAPRIGWGRAIVGPTLVAVIAAGLTLAAIVKATRSAWLLLGAGAGVIPDEHLPLWGFALVFATTLGQTAGWAAISALAYHVPIRAGLPPTVFAGKLAMSLVYAALGALPLLVYHVFFGGPLLGLARHGVAARLAADYPDAHLLLFTLHPIVDLSVIPLAAVFLGCLWLLAPERSAGPRYGLALALIGTFLAIALSLATHSTLVHLRF